MTQPAFTQVTFRLRNDNGSETTATWRQTQGTDDTLLTDTNYRVRFRIDETAVRAWSSVTWNLFYSLNSGTYTQIGSGQPVNYSLSSNFAQGDDCTAQLTGGSGTFVTANAGMCESAGAVNSGTGGYLFEVEYCIQIDSAYVANGDTINLRVYNGTSAIAAYTDTPVITVSKPAVVNLTTAGITAGGQALTVVKGAVSKALNSGTISAAGRVITVAPGVPPTSRNLNTAAATASGVVISVNSGTPPDRNIPLNTAVITTAGIILDVVPGARTIPLVTAGATAGGVRITPVLLVTIRPNADTYREEWTNEAGSTVNIYQSIDETTPSDSDYIKSMVLPVTNSYKCKLQTASDPGIHSGHSVTIRFKKPYAVGTVSLTVKLWQGVTTIATWNETVTTSWQTITETLTEGQAATITDYAELYLEFIANAT